MKTPNLIKLMYRNMKVNTDPGTLLILIGLPGMYLVFFGYGFQSILASAGTGKVVYLRFLTPGIMALQSLMAGTLGGSMLWADKRWGMLAQLLVGPFTRLEYLLGIMMTSVVFAVAGALVMFGGAIILLAGVPTQLLGGLVMFGVIVLGSIFFGSLVLYISALVKSQNAYNSIQILVIFVVNFASTVFFQTNSLPEALKILFIVNPLTYEANAVRDSFLGIYSVSDAYQVALLFAETVLMLFLAVRAYMRSNISFV